MAAAARAHAPFYLRQGPSGSVTSLNDGSLTPARPAVDERRPRYSYPDWEWRNGVVAFVDGRPDPVRRVLTFTSAPLEADLEVTGPIVLKLYASSDQIDTQFIVKLADQHPQESAAARQGRAAGIDRSCRRAGSRPRTARRTKRARPTSGRSTPTPIRSRSRPDEIYQFDIEVLPISYVFKTGHRIRLEIVNGNSPLTDAVFSHPYHPTQIGSDTIYHDAAHASCLMLPVVA